MSRTPSLAELKNRAKHLLGLSAFVEYDIDAIQPRLLLVFQGDRGATEKIAITADGVSKPDVRMTLQRRMGDILRALERTCDE